MTFALVLAGCGDVTGTPAVPTSTLAPGPTSTIAPASEQPPGILDQLAAQVCEGSSYEACVERVVVVLGTVESGTMLVICEHGDGQGDVVIVHPSETADPTCPGGDFLIPSTVFATFEAP